MPVDWLTGPESTGAAAGAAIAVGSTLKRDGISISVVRFFSGYWFGFAGAEPLLNWLMWESTEPMRMFAASVIGLVAFIAVQIILAEKTKTALQGLASAVIGKVTAK